jgi:serine/threonine-protein phosphatase 5
VVKRAPADADAKSKMVECEKIVRRIEFEKAIEVSRYLFFAYLVHNL